MAEEVLRLKSQSLVNLRQIKRAAEVAQAEANLAAAEFNLAMRKFLVENDMEPEGWTIDWEELTVTKIAQQSETRG